jgi:WD40 repeat protein
MPRNRTLLACALLLAAPAAGAARGQSAAKDLHGDPLPPGAITRLGTARFRHDHVVVFAAFLPGGKRILSVSEEGGLRVWDFPSGKELHRLETLAGQALATGATLSPDSKHLTVFADDGFLHIWDWANDKEIGQVAKQPMPGSGRAFSGPARASADPVYSPDSKTLMFYGSSRVLQLIDLPAGKEISPGPGHADSLTSISFTPDGTQIVTADAKVTHLWDAATGKDLGAVKVKVPPTLVGGTTFFSADGRIGVSVARFSTPAVAQAAKARDAVLFDTVSGKELGTIGLEVEVTPYHRRPIVFSPDAKLLAANAADGREKINLYEVPTGKLLRTLDGGPAAAPGRFAKAKGVGPGVAVKAGFGFGAFPGTTGQKMLFSPDGKVLAFQSDRGGTILVLDTTTGKTLASLAPLETNPILQGAFAAHGRCLALEGSDGKVTLIELATGRPRCTFGNPLPGSPAVRIDPDEPFGGGGSWRTYRGGFALSPDSKLLALAALDGSIRLWDLWSAKELAAFKGQGAVITALAFSPSGKRLASAGQDTTALIWDVSKVGRPALPAKAPKAPKAGDLDAWWRALAENDAAAAFAAMGALADVPQDAVTWLEARVKPAPPLDMKRAMEQLRQLEDEQYDARERATAELKQLGEVASPLIDKMLAGQLNAETRRRLEQVRDKLASAVLEGDRLRGVRVVEVLEHIGTPQARAVLQALADGAPGAVLTASAQAALKR